MFTTSLDLDQLTDILAAAKVFERVDGPGPCYTYLLDHDGKERVIVYDTMSGKALMVDAPSTTSEPARVSASALDQRLATLPTSITLDGDSIVRDVKFGQTTNSSVLAMTLTQRQCNHSRLGRRNFKLEPVTWQGVDHLAEQHGQTWDDFIADIIERNPDAENVSALIRSTVIDGLLDGTLGLDRAQML